MFLRGFILQPSDRASIKKGTRDFQNSSQFERSACFYVTITESFKALKQLSKKTKTFFQKHRVPFFSWKVQNRKRNISIQN